MRDDWLILDRVIDVPVYQDILTWDGLSQAIGLRSRFLGLFKSRVPHGARKVEGCGLLADS